MRIPTRSLSNLSIYLCKVGCSVKMKGEKKKRNFFLILLQHTKIQFLGYYMKIYDKCVHNLLFDWRLNVLRYIYSRLSFNFYEIRFILSYVWIYEFSVRKKGVNQRDALVNPVVNFCGLREFPWFIKKMLIHLGYGQILK